MKIVIAFDSFKGSLSSMDAGYAAEKGIKKVLDAEVVIKPLADGGEGTTESLIEGLGGEYVFLNVTGPLGKQTRARYGILSDGKTAVMEMAQAAGIILVKKEELDPRKATTYGLGEMILDAIERGCREFIIGIGGSATSDGGVGMLQAFGYEFTDEKECKIGTGLQDLDRICRISDRNVPEILKKCHFQIACDVENPLCGENGAVYIFGPQKGIEDVDKKKFDRKMLHYADCTQKFTGKDYRNIKGAGAAGGLGFAFISYLPNVRLNSGIDIVLNSIRLEEEIKDADIVITGEGCLDYQTSMGKAPIGVACLAKKYGAKVIAFAGNITEDAAKCNQSGIDAFFSIIRGVATLEEAMDPENAKKNMELSVEQVFRLLLA